MAIVLAEGVADGAGAHPTDVTTAYSRFPGVLREYGVERVVDVRVLGGLSVDIAGTEVHLGTPKQQLVFAMLALNPARLVTVDELVDELWPDRPPQSAVANVRTYAATLRRTLRGAAGRDQLYRSPGGYRLEARAEQVDVLSALRPVSPSTS